MIARFWSAHTTADRVQSYADHLRTRVLPELQALDGYAGADLLQRSLPDGVEIVVITWWRSLDAIRAFAGPDLEQAVVADEAARLLERFDRRVRHYEVVASGGERPGS